MNEIAIISVFRTDMYFGRVWVFAALFAAVTMASPRIRDPNLKLLLVQVVTRHGARTTFESVPPSVEALWLCHESPLMAPDAGDASLTMAPEMLFRKVYLDGQEMLHGNCSQGQLTVVGSQMHFMLGQMMREAYVVDEPVVNGPTSVYVRSTDVPRTVESAMAQMLGLLGYPLVPGSGAVPVVDVHTVELEGDYLAPLASCGPVVAACNAVVATPEWAQQESSLADDAAALRAAWGVSELPEWFLINDAVYARSFHSLPPPAGVTTAMAERIMKLSSWQMGALYGSPAAQRLGVGALLQMLLTNMQNAVGSNVSQRYHLYSAHDTSMGMLSSALGLWTGRWPGFASHMLFELYVDQRDGEPMVNIEYYDAPPTTHQSPAVLYTSLSSLFVQLVDVLIDIDDWRLECASSPTNPATKMVSLLC